MKFLRSLLLIAVCALTLSVSAQSLPPMIAPVEPPPDEKLIPLIPCHFEAVCRCSFDKTTGIDTCTYTLELVCE